MTPKKVLKKLCELNPIVVSFVGEVLSEDRINEFFNKTIGQILKSPTKDQVTAAYTCYKVLNTGRPSRKLKLQAVLIRTMANLHLISEGLPPSFWDGSRTSAIMQCFAVEPDKERTNKKYLIVSLICLSGYPAGLMFKVSLSANMLEYVLGKKLGLSFKKYNAAAEEISGCLFKCNIQEDMESTVITDWDASASMKEANQKLAEERLKLNKCKTPNLPCSVCRKTRAECRLAVWKEKNG